MLMHIDFIVGNMQFRMKQIDCRISDIFMVKKINERDNENIWEIPSKLPSAN